MTYLDRKLGLPLWNTYDPCVKAMICELYANQNSTIKVGEILGDKLFSPFSTASHRHQYRISRQTVHNTLRSSLLIKQTHKPQETTPEELYIMADEKYIPLQKGNTRKVMVNL